LSNKGFIRMSNLRNLALTETQAKAVVPISITTFKKPIVLFPSGYTVEEAEIENLKTCPVTHTAIVGYKTNWALKDILSGGLQDASEGKHSQTRLITISPELISCPVTKEIYHTPVVLFPSGFTLEKSVAERISHCPMTRLAITGHVINKEIATLVAKYIENNPTASAEQFQPDNKQNDIILPFKIQQFLRLHANLKNCTDELEDLNFHLHTKANIQMNLARKNMKTAGVLTTAVGLFAHNLFQKNTISPAFFWSTLGLTFFSSMAGAAYHYHESSKLRVDAHKHDQLLQANNVLLSQAQTIEEEMLRQNHRF